ncbi:MAG: PRC-barrel domain-containing protein [Xenococcaceae cyanobacterium]
MTTENNRLRAEFINTQVIARNTGKRLGVVKEVLVDIDRREVVALGLRDNMLSVSGIPKYMYIDNIRQSSDVILVENEDVIEDVDVDAYNRLINCEVITETGEPLGRVRDFQFNADNGKVFSLIIASLGIPQIPEQFISTYEISMDEVVSSGPNRLIVFEGAEERINQLTVGLLERLGIGRPPWERDDEEIGYPAIVKSENQLPTGIKIETPINPPIQRTPVMEEVWDEDEWQQSRSAPPQRRQAESIRYEEYEEEEVAEDNWSEVREEPARARYEPPAYPSKSREYDYEYEDTQEDIDMWDDDGRDEQPYNPPPVNIPQKKKEKTPEYEEEAG